MRETFFRMVVLMLAAQGAVPALAQESEAPQRVQEVVSPGGIQAYLVSEPSIPFLSLSFRFAGGSALDPAGKEGVAYLISGLLDEGAGELDGQAFRTALEDDAIRLSFDASRDEFTGLLKTLTESRERGFELLRLALTQPRFDDEAVERIRSQVQAELRRRSEEPDYIASLTWFQTAFQGHPYGRPIRGTEASVAAITTPDLHDFVTGRFARDNLVIGVAGDVTPEELGPLLDLAFGDLPASGTPVEVAATRPEGAETVIVRKDVPQSQVIFGESGIARTDPDYYAAYVANYILGGGGFRSRLMEEVREKRGLAYSAYSYLYPTEQAPIWLGGVGTDNTRVAESIQIVRAEVARMAERGIDAAELEDAKTYLTGSFPLRLTSNDQIAGMLVGIQVHDLGLDYIDRRNDYVDAVTIEDVRRVAARLYDPEALLVVVVGNPAGLEG